MQAAKDSYNKELARKEEKFEEFKRAAERTVCKYLTGQ